MHWIVSSLLMFFSSVALYLSVRKGNMLQIPQQLLNLSMFLIPALIFTVMAIKAGIQFELSTLAYAIIIIQSIFFAYIGNVFSLLGMKSAPNPGYSLMISKSYVVLTAVASIFLFDAPLPLKSVVAIIAILGFSALIMIDPSKKNSESGRLWLLYSIGTFFCWGLLALSTKYLLDMGVPILARLIYSMLIASALILGEMSWKKVSVTGLNKEQLAVLLGLGIFGAGFTYFMQLAYTTAPNVGFVNATNAASISLLTLLSAYFFKDDLSTKKLIGIIGVTLGLVGLFL